MAQSLVEAWPEIADRLAKKFWPGPLTLVLPLAKVETSSPGGPPGSGVEAKSKARIPKIVTAGLSTVALRMPAHPIALALIEAAGLPLAAPSANRFTELSPTTAEHVRQGLGAEVDLIIDGGPCAIGIESTVLSLVESTPVLLRPGAISRAELEALVGPVARAGKVSSGAHLSPGMHPRHYRPRTSLLLVTNGNLPDTGYGIYLQHTHASRRENIATVEMPSSAAGYAAALYDELHKADGGHYEWIAVDVPPQTPDWEAVNDRLRRAASNS